MLSSTLPVLGGSPSPIDRRHHSAGKHSELTSYLSEMPYQLPPISNFMFMRDPSAIVGNGVVVGHMAFPARQREAWL